MLFYTGIQRSAEAILHEQKRSASPQTLLKLKKLVPQFCNILVKDRHENSSYQIGHLLDCAWQLKRSLCDSISSPNWTPSMNVLSLRVRWEASFWERVAVATSCFMFRRKDNRQLQPLCLI